MKMLVTEFRFMRDGTRTVVMIVFPFVARIYLRLLQSINMTTWLINIEHIKIGKREIRKIYVGGGD